MTREMDTFLHQLLKTTLGVTMWVYGSMDTLIVLLITWPEALASYAILTAMVSKTFENLIQA